LSAGAPQVRDASAASVAVCAFQELARHNAADTSILQTKDALLNRLSREDYLNFNDAVAGIQRNGQVGFGVNSYTSWGDYFLMEALARELYQAKTWW